MFTVCVPYFVYIIEHNKTMVLFIYPRSSQLFWCCHCWDFNRSVRHKEQHWVLWCVIVFYEPGKAEEIGLSTKRHFARSDEQSFSSYLKSFYVYKYWNNTIKAVTNSFNINNPCLRLCRIYMLASCIVLVSVQQ